MGNSFYYVDYNSVAREMGIDVNVLVNSSKLYQEAVITKYWNAKLDLMKKNDDEKKINTNENEKLLKKVLSGIKKR